MKTSYEWVYEPMDKNGDIIDPIFADSYSEVIKYINPDEFPEYQTHEIALVRNTGDEINGLQERGYAYLRNGRLEPVFDNGYDVPKRFLKDYS